MPQTTEVGYICSRCGASDVKLWREYNTFANLTELYCADCSMQDQGKVGEVDADGRRECKYGQKTDQIGWLVPAVPADDGAFWGYSSVPEDRVQWWRKLPTRRKD